MMAYTSAPLPPLRVSIQHHYVGMQYDYLMFIFWGFLCVELIYISSHSRIFHSYGDVTFASEGLQILTYPRHLWPLSSEGSLTCHTYCDTDLPFIMVISEDRGSNPNLPLPQCHRGST